MRGRALAALVALAVVDLAGPRPGLPRPHGLRSLRSSARPRRSRWASPPTASPTGERPATTQVVGPVLLGVNAAGDVLRATRGACEERFDNPARIWAGNVDDGVALSAVEPPASREVLGLMVYADGRLRVSGSISTTDDAMPVTFDSTDGGATWQTHRRRVDALAPVRRRHGVHGHRSLGADVAVPCPAAQIVNLPARRALASCARADLLHARPGGATHRPDRI